MNKKILFFIILLLILVLNTFLYFFGEKSKKTSAINSNKLFEIEIEKSSKDSQVKVINNIDQLNKDFNFFIPNFSLLFFDLPENFIEQINEISNIIFAPRFGFQKISIDFLEKIKEMNINNIYFRIFIKNEYSNSEVGFNSSSDEFINGDKASFSREQNQTHEFILSSAKLKPIVINTNYFTEENKEIFSELEKLKNKYNIDFYINEEDLIFLDGNSDLIDLLINLKPLLVNTNKSCSSESNLCFFQKSENIESILEKIKSLREEIIRNKIQKKNILLGISGDRKDILPEEFAKKIKEIIYCGSLKSD
jgi:hypothetical protein